MLYPESKREYLEEDTFQNPPSNYRSAPFWAWNGELDKEELKRQIGIFQSMGFGGFHMHVRTGLSTKYLSEEFMDDITCCIDEAKRLQMKAYLYDEDRWPSGSCGGRVTAGKKENSRKSLLFTPFPYEEDRPNRAVKPEPGRGQNCVRQDNGVLLSVYDVVLDKDGYLLSGSRIDENQAPQGKKWYAYMEYASDDPWFNNSTYVDTLNYSAISDFIASTHERYFECEGGEFGKTVPSIFTDEPQFTQKKLLNFALEQKDVFLPWGENIEQEYKNRYNEDLLDNLCLLIWEQGGENKGKCSSVRWKFQNLITDMFVSSYCSQIGSWCRDHNVLLTGHVMGEPTLDSQTGAVGDAMRCYPSFDIPGIDMLCDNHEYTTAKQTASMVHQEGKEGMLSELYGVTGWDYDFRGYKLQGDWQAALGVTLRVPHLSWMSMKGEAKRDYPATISYQSPWYKEFSLVENHFARLNTALTRGKSIVNVAVVHPIESYYLIYGPENQTSQKRSEMEQDFEALTETLLFGTIDFDFLCENELPRQWRENSLNDVLTVGEMEYQTVVIPNLTTIRSTTVDILEKFVSKGGDVLFISPSYPQYVDGVESDRCKRLFEQSRKTSSSPGAVLSALEERRVVDIRTSNGKRENTLVYQLRQDGKTRWLFVANGKNPECCDVDNCGEKKFTISGEWQTELYDTMTGNIYTMPSKIENGTTVIVRPWHIHESMLLHLLPMDYPAKERPLWQEVKSCSNEVKTLLSPVKYSLTEENMLLLDMAQYSINKGKFNQREEILRLDNYVREQMGIPLRRKEICQPYAITENENAPHCSVTLRFSVYSHIKAENVHLALEDRDKAEILFNGNKITAAADGYFVDKAIEKVPIGIINPGENIIEVTLPLAERTNLEYCYLLGDFGVEVYGSRAEIVNRKSTLAFGNMVSQSLPFYTGNTIYSFDIISYGDFTLRVPKFRGAMVKVVIDGNDGSKAGKIAFSPYTVNVDEKNVAPGVHHVELVLYGTRYNGFAQLHHTQGVYFYQSANSWRSSGDLWQYEYLLKPQGILKSPELTGADFIDSEGNVISHTSAADHMQDES